MQIWFDNNADDYFAKDLISVWSLITIEKKCIKLFLKFEATYFPSSMKINFIESLAQYGQTLVLERKHVPRSQSIKD